MEKFLTFIMCLLLWSNGRLLTSGIPKSFLLTSGFTITNQRLSMMIPYETEASITIEGCGGRVSKAPGALVLILNKKQVVPTSPVHCQWILQAQENQRAYIRDLEITRISTGTEFIPNEIDNSPAIEIYDGEEVDSNKLLYRFGNDSLNNCVSRSQNLTIDLHHSLIAEYTEEKLIFNYGFADESRLTWPSVYF